MRKIVLYFSLALIFVFVSTTVYGLIILVGDYAIDEEKLIFKSATTLVDENGEEITKIYIENREPVSIKKIPKHVLDAFISIEDARFYKHYGVDFKAISRAMYRNVLSLNKVEGGSTITQQLAKNTFLSSEKSITRKVKELFISMNLEYRYSKRQILEWYLNQVYFGHGTYGIQAASKFYFNKDVQNLTVSEGAMLAALLKAPSTYSPILHADESLTRRNLVLQSMGKLGYLTPKEVLRNKGTTLGLQMQERKDEPQFASYIDLVLEEAERVYHFSNYELLRGGYTIVVPMNKKIQESAYRILQDSNQYDKSNKDIQSSFVLLDNKNGGVIAAYGGRNYVSKGINRVLIQRQPGSTFKPLAVYAPAMELKKYTPYSLLPNEQMDFQGYKPKNYKDKYTNKISLYDAILYSANVPAVYVLDKISVQASKDFLSKLQLQLPDSGLAVALGGLNQGVSPLQLSGAYRTFATNGMYSTPRFINQIKDSTGDVITESEEEPIRVFSEQTSWYITKMLQSVVQKGTAVTGQYDGVLAGKTGTTNWEGKKNAVRDVWFVGYTPSFVGAIWLGFDRTDESHYVSTGSSQATILFKKILQETADKNKIAFTKPKDVKDLEPPVHLAKIESFRGEIDFTPLSLFTAHFTWDKQPDDRVVYRLYREEEGEDKFITQVTGESTVSVKYLNLFTKKRYYLVPYDKYTKQEGTKSEAITLSY